MDHSTPSTPLSAPLTSFDSLIEYLKGIVRDRFVHNVLVRSNDAVILHVMSGGLPWSRHPCRETSDRRTLEAEARVLSYSNLVWRLAMELEAPVHLLELSNQDVDNFRRDARTLRAMWWLGERMGDVALAHEHGKLIDRLVNWNPVLQLHEQPSCRVTARSIWPDRMSRPNDNPCLTFPRQIGDRMDLLIQGMRESMRPDSLELRVLYTEGATDLKRVVESRNSAFLAGRMRGVIGLVTIREA